MLTFFTPASPDLEIGNQTPPVPTTTNNTNTNRTNKTTFTGDTHRGRAHVARMQNPVFGPKERDLNPFGRESQRFRNDTIFRAPESPSPRSGSGVGVWGSERESDREREGERESGRDGRMVLEESGIDRRRIRNVEGSVKANMNMKRPVAAVGILGGVGVGGGSTGTGREPEADRGRGYSFPEPSQSIPRESHTARLKRSLRERTGRGYIGLDRDKRDEEDEEHGYRERLFKEVLRRELSAGIRMDEEERGTDRRGASDGLVMKQEGYNEQENMEGCRYEAKDDDEGDGEFLPRNLQEFMQKYDPNPQGISDGFSLFVNE
ncbi:hypothetical protein ACMFMG_011129 [Clarireedia jacksonii]